MWAIEIIGLLVLGVWVWLIYQMWKYPAHPLPKEEEKPKEKEVRRSISKLPTGKAIIIGVGSGIDTGKKFNDLYEQGRATNIDQPIDFGTGNHIYPRRDDVNDIYSWAQKYGLDDPKKFETPADIKTDAIWDTMDNTPTETFEGFGNGGDNGFGGGGADASWGDTGSSDTGSSDFSAGE